MVFLQVSSLETQFDCVVVFTDESGWVGKSVMEEALPSNAPASSCLLGLLLHPGGKHRQNCREPEICVAHNKEAVNADSSPVLQPGSQSHQMR